MILQEINNLISLTPQPNTKIFYHGSPLKLEKLTPYQAKGHNDFENLNAVFMTDIFDHAAIYAIGKTLKGKTWFMITPTDIYILGDENISLGKGYVYYLKPNSIIKGPEHQFASLEILKPLKIIEVFPQDYKNNIHYIKTKEEFIALAKKLYPEKMKK